MALIRKSPSNRTTVSPATTGQAGISKTITSPYFTSTPAQKVSLQGYADKYNIAARLPSGSTSTEILTAAQSDLVRRTAYLQPTAQELAKGNFAQFGANITAEQYASQRTSLSAVQVIGRQTGVQTAASSPAPGGKGSVTPETFKAFTQDIALEEMFGMLGSGSAANIRLAQAQTGADIGKLIAAENKALGIRQNANLNQPAFQYSPTDASRIAAAKATGDVRAIVKAIESVGGGQQNLYNAEGEFLYTTNYQTSIPDPIAGRKTSGLIEITPAQQKQAVAQTKARETELLAAKGIDVAPLTSFNDVKIGAFSTAAPTTTAKLPSAESLAERNTRVANTITSVQNPGIIETQVVGFGADAGSQYRKDFVALTGYDIFNTPTNIPKTVKPIKDLSLAVQGKSSEYYPEFLGKLTLPGSNPNSSLAGQRFADLYEPVSPGSKTLKLTSSGSSFASTISNLNKGINVSIKKK
jgi:hypothetical protein